MALGYFEDIQYFEPVLPDSEAVLIVHIKNVCLIILIIIIMPGLTHHFSSSSHFGEEDEKLSKPPTVQLHPKG